MILSLWFELSNNITDETNLFFERLCLNQIKNGNVSRATQRSFVIRDNFKPRFCSIETGVEKHLTDCSQCQTAIGGIYFTKK
jgi:hypothetical protein